MILGDIKLSYPCVKYDVIVTHFTARKSAAIEWVILEVINRFANNSDYGAITLDKVFEQILQISDSDLLIKPCLKQLVDLNAITVIGLNDSVSLNEILLRDVQLTEIGMEMQKKGLLPGVDNENKVELYFDVVNNNTFELKAVNLRDHSNGMQIKQISSESEIVFPRSVINEQLLMDKQNGRYQWLQTTTTIKNIERQYGQLLWRNLNRKINITSNGRIVVEGVENDAGVNSLLLNNQVLLASEYDDHIIEKEMVTDIDQEYKNIVCSDEVPEQLEQILKTGQIALVDSNFWDKKYACNDKEIKVQILFNCKEFGIQYDFGKTIILQVENAMPYSKCIALTDHNNLFCAKFTLYNDAGSITSTLGYSKKHIGEQFCLQDILGSLIEQYKTKDSTILPLYLLSDDEEGYLKSVPLVIQGLLTIESKLIAIENLNAICSKISKKKINLDVVLGGIIENEILSKGNYDTLDQIINVFDQILMYSQFASSPSVVQASIAYILDNIDYVKDHVDTLKILSYFAGTKKINEVWISQKCLVDNLYSKRVLVSLFDRIMEENYLNDSKNYYTDAEKIYKQMKVLLRSLSDILPGLDFSSLCSKEKMFELIIPASEKFNNIRELLLTWNDNKFKLESKLISFSELVHESKILDCIEQNMGLITEVLAVFMDDDLLKYDRVFILDTNVFIEKPNILEMFSSKELIVVPAKILDELDGLKTREHEDLAYKAREAIRQLDKYGRKIKYENAHPELLPIDLRKDSADNLILSVAIKYIAKKPMVIANDINMRNKAKSQNIDVTSINGLLGMKEQEIRQNSDKNSKAGSKKKKKK